MLPQYPDTRATKEILSLHWIPFIIAQCLHNKAAQLRGLEAFRCECEAVAVLEEFTHNCHHFFKAWMALCLQYYLLGDAASSQASYGGRGGRA